MSMLVVVLLALNLLAEGEERWRHALLNGQYEIYPGLFRAKLFTQVARGQSVKTVLLKEGQYAIPFLTRDNDEVSYVTVSSMAFGDLTGDGKAEAAVGLYLKSGGTMSRALLLLFDLSGRAPAQLLMMYLGDRSNFGCKSVTIRDRRLIVDLYSPNESEGDCCATRFSQYEFRYSQQDGLILETHTDDIPLPRERQRR